MEEICTPVQASPSPPPQRRRSRPGRPCATWPTGSMDNAMVKWTGAVARGARAPPMPARVDAPAPGAPTHPTRQFHIPRRTRTPTLRPTDNPLNVLAIQPSRGPVSGGARMKMPDTSNRPLLPTGSLSRSNCAGPSDEHRRDEHSRSNRPVERAKIFVAAARRVEITDEMMPFDQHLSRQRYTRLRCRRSGTAFDSLTPAAEHDPRRRLRPAVWELRPTEVTEHKVARHAPFATFLAGRRRGDFVDLTHAQTPAQPIPNHVGRQHEKSRPLAPVISAKKCVVPGQQARAVNAMSPRNNHPPRHPYPDLRPSRISGATYPLSEPTLHVPVPVQPPSTGNHSSLDRLRRRVTPNCTQPAPVLPQEVVAFTTCRS